MLSRLGARWVFRDEFLMDALTGLEGMRLLRIAEKALVPTASAARVACLSLETTFEAVVRWNVALFT